MTSERLAQYPGYGYTIVTIPGELVFIEVQPEECIMHYDVMSRQSHIPNTEQQCAS